eukprot:4679360-Amphidinium_carterae.7
MPGRVQSSTVPYWCGEATWCQSAASVAEESGAVQAHSQLKHPKEPQQWAQHEEHYPPWPQLAVVAGCGASCGLPERTGVAEPACVCGAEP